jgi:hypothetical protein
LIKDVADVAAVAHVGACSPDTNNVISRSDAAACTSTQPDVGTASCIVSERLKTDGCVVIAHCIAIKRPTTVGRVTGTA